VTAGTTTRVTAAVAGPVVISAGLAALTVLTGSAWLMLLTGAGAGLIVAALLLRPGLADLTMAMTGPARAAVGEPVTHRLRVHNGGPTSSPPLRLTHALHGLPDTTVYVGALLPGGSAEVEITRTALQRGVTEGCQISLMSSAPLGLLAVTRAAAYHQPFVVHPAVVPPGRLFAHRRGVDDAVDPEPGPGLDIAGIREWQHGDDPRRVHWRSTARRGRLIVAERGLGTATALSVVVVGPSEAPDWEETVALAAATCRAAQLDGRQVSVRAWNGTLAGPVVRPRSIGDLLDWWAGLGATALPWPAALVEAGPGDPTSRELTVVASAHVRPAWWGELSARSAAAGLAVKHLEPVERGVRR
jgi:uncharacterized protein (DUF58 family)